MYVDAYHNKKTNIIHVVERNKDGKRVYKEYTPDYSFYVSDPKGKYTTIFREPVSKIKCNNEEQFRKELAINSNKKIYESDLNLVYKLLYQNYHDCDTPKLHVGFFDIEVDFSPLLGYASAEDAFMPIISISIYLDWLDEIVTLAIPPKKLGIIKAQQLVKDIDNVYLFNDEKDLLIQFLEIIDDVDILSGWNCVPTTNTIWKENKIDYIENICIKEDLHNNNFVKFVFPRSTKNVVSLSLYDGSTLYSSEDHIFPILFKNKNTYIGDSNLCIYAEKEWKNIDTKTYDIYVKKEYGCSLPDLTYRRLLLDNIEYLWDKGLRFKIHDSLILKKRSLLTGKSCHLLLKQQHWEYREICDLLGIEEIKKFIERSHTVNVWIEGMTKNTKIVLDNIISADDLWLLGFWYTDGTNSYKSEITYCNKNINIIEKIKSITNRTYRKGKDNVYYYGDGISCRNNAILKAFIYNSCLFKSTKSLDITLLSQLSRNQFLNLCAGMLDGDGIKSKYHPVLCSYIPEDIKKLSELSYWNKIPNLISKNTITFRFNEIDLDYLNSKVISQRIQECKPFIPKNSKSRVKNFIYDEDGIWIKIRNKQHHQHYVEMIDIKTFNNYFVTNGVKVHNCEGFDIPYTVHRISKVLSKNDSRKLCLWDQLPKKKEFERFGKQQLTYDLIGRLHIDYLQLYKKFTYEERHTYRLDYIGEIEVNANKEQYDGTLDQLYNNDFKKFIIYNRQDANIVHLLDNKLKFIELINSMSHENKVLIPTALGSVALIDQAILNEIHNSGFIAPNKPKNSEDVKIAGAYVAHPKVGLHEWIGVMDVNSLYPSMIRCLNMSTETLVGQIELIETKQQIKQYLDNDDTVSKFWENKFGVLEFEQVLNRDKGIELLVKWSNGNEEILSGAELYNKIYNSNSKLILTANGTIFSYENEGFIPQLLSKWYTERKEMQAKSKDYEKLLKGITLPDRFGI